MQPPVPLPEHEWLTRFVGDWRWETEPQPDDGGVHTGTESVRRLGEVWFVLEGTATPPGGPTAASLMTLGFHPEEARYVGTFHTTTMPFLWTYRGWVEADGRTLVLEAEGPSFEAEGPSFEAEGQMRRYRDTHRFESEDHRVLHSTYLAADGEWKAFSTAHYRRVGG